MDFLDSIDFENHNGVYLPMLNDVARNQFYDCILPEVRDQDCVEIGFGTGFLSVLALKHGARSIVAYELDHTRYKLGCEVIKLLKLQDRITLLNQRYTHDCENNATVIFTETVDGNLWGEGLYNSFPRQPGKRFLPGKYFLEIYAVPLSTEVALRLMQAYEKTYFSPGVDIDTKFVSYINLLLSKKYNKPVKIKTQLPTGVTELPITQKVLDFANNTTCVGKYVIDANKGFVDTTVQEFKIDVGAQPMLIIPRPGMQHNDHVLYLDINHWELAKNPAIVNALHQSVTVSHDLLTGKISYQIQG